MSSVKVTVIDYGVGNLLSVQRGLEKCGSTVTISSDPKVILNSEKVVFPGVGAFPDGMKALKKLDLISVIQDYVLSQKPLLAICLGMEMLFDESCEFSVTSGLALIPGKVVPVPSTATTGEKLKIPHISYMAVPKFEENLVSTVTYGGNSLAAVVQKNNLTGCQFHPEKSGEVGLRILKRFCND
jgi:glutamine amidotransferase